MKIAAIDLGSNSIHLVIVEVSPSGGFQVVASEKEMVRLGAATLARGRLSAAAMGRGLEVLRKYKRLAASHRVDKILAVATSAIREARNGEDYLIRVGEKTGIWPRVASGEGEARLIYLAALHSIHLEGKRALVVDVGGGSVELALGTGTRPDWVGLREARRPAHGRAVRPARSPRRQGRGQARGVRQGGDSAPPGGGGARAALLRHRHLGHHPGPRPHGSPDRDGTGARLPQPRDGARGHPRRAARAPVAADRCASACACPASTSGGPTSCPWGR